MRISVALCTSDDASTLPTFLESLLSQTRQPDELVVRDDRSVDDTVAIARAFDAPFPVRVEVNERRLGPGVNHGVVLADCTGDEIAIGSTADVWHPQRIERTIGASEGFVFCNAALDGTTLWDAAGFDASRRETARRGDLLPIVIAHPFIPASTTTINARLRDLVAPVPEHVSFDAWLATLALLIDTYDLVDEPLMRYGGDVAAPSAVMPDESAAERRRTSVRGARRKLSLRDADLHRQGRRAQAAFYDAVVERFDQASQAYNSKHGSGDELAAEIGVREMRARAKHLRARGALPNSRAKRLPVVMGELRSGRYTRYSSGLLSAFQDLVY